MFELFTPLRVGGRPHRKFFGSVLVIRYWTCVNFVCSVVWMFSFNTHAIYTFFGIKSVQNTGSYSVVSCCFNLFFKNNIIFDIYAFFNIKLVQDTGFCSVFNTLTCQILWKHLYLQFFFHCCPFFRCRKPPKPQNDPKLHLNTSQYPLQNFKGPPQLKLI